jgi:hypothetical protein
LRGNVEAMIGYGIAEAEICLLIKNPATGKPIDLATFHASPHRDRAWRTRDDRRPEFGQTASGLLERKIIAPAFDTRRPDAI